MKIKTGCILSFAGLLAIFVLFALPSCDKDNGDRLPLPPMDMTIDPNSTLYQEINVVGGWMYLGEQDGALPPSRGVIVYRLSTDEFIAFERTPPFKPDSCCNNVCTRLIVDQYYPYVMDTCTSSKYLILDGSPVSGPAYMTLGIYICEYYGDWLYIHD